MAEPTLSEAIGLQAKPNWSLAQYALKKADAEDAARAKALAAQRQKDDEAFNKMIKDADAGVDRSKYHNVYLGAADKTWKMTLDQAMKAHTDDPHNLLAVTEILNNGASKLKELQNRSAVMFQEDKDVAEGKKYADPEYIKMRSTGDFSDTYVNPQTGNVESKSWGDLSKVANRDARYQHTFNPDGSYVSNLIKKVDFTPNRDKFLANKMNYNVAGTTRKGLGGGYEAFNVENVTDPQKADMEAMALLSDKDNFNSFLMSRKNEYDADLNKLKSDPANYKGLLKLDANGNVDPQSVMLWTHDNMVNSLFTGRYSDFGSPQRIPEDKTEKERQNPVEVGNKVLPISGATVSKKGEKLEYFQNNVGDLFQKINGKFHPVDESGKTDLDKSVSSTGLTIAASPAKKESWEGRNTKTFNAVDIRVTPKAVIDMNTGGHIEGVANTEYQVSEITKLPYTVNAKTGELNFASPKTVREQPNKIRYDYFAIGTEKGGMQQGEQIITPTAVPLTKEVYSAIKDHPKNGVNLNIPENELFGGKGKKAIQATPAQAPAKAAPAKTPLKQVTTSAQEFEEKARKKGMSVDELKESLKNNGWDIIIK